ncbi:hypothetical protein WBG78_19345 [Chryseolinea sp. T2]|uniref:hypothetical protein n=1 Tax=Chryseolinea sp. T2 TaxID=3129255 RepID=UPI0030779F63
MRKNRSPLYARHFFALILTGFFLSACFDDHSGDDSQSLVSLDPLAISFSSTNHWVYATDVNGEVLDVQNTVGRKQVTLTSTRYVDKFNLNIVTGTVDTNGKTYLQIQTYADVSPGSSFEVRYGNGGMVLTDPANVNFRIAGYDGPKYGINITNKGSYFSYDVAMAGDTYEANLQLCQLPSDVLLTTYRNGTPVYARIPGVKGGDVLNLDMDTNFTPFEHQRKLDFGGYYNIGWVQGAYIEGNKYLPQFYFDLIETDRLAGTKDATDQPVIGYVDGFDSYSMYVANAQPSGYVSYFKQGDIEDSFDSFTMPTFTYKTINTGLRNFTFEFSEDYSYYEANFSNESATLSMNWSIHTPSGVAVNIGDLPREVLAEYPMIDPDTFWFDGIKLTKVISGESFHDSILRIGTPQSPEFEYYTFSPNL